MANNRMIMVCNKCFPTDCYKFGDDIAYIGKWYPIGDYRSTMSDEQLGEKINNYLIRHAHSEDIELMDRNDPSYKDALALNENPVRLTYETWVRDMPAIKKWEYKPRL